MRRNFLILLLAGATTALQAQNLITNDEKSLMKEAHRLYTDGEYTTALTILDKIETKTLGMSAQREAELLRAKATFGGNHLEGRALLLQYLADYPEASDRDIVNALIGESYYYDHKFAQANEWFKKADLSRMDTKERERAELHYALTMQECGESEMARNMLTNLALTGKQYAEDARFHLAVIQYHNDETEQAYKGFKEVELSDKYHLDVPYYLAGIYVKQGKYEQAEQIATAYIADHKNKPQGKAMQQMLGASLFGQGRYDEAVAPLQSYMEATPAEKRQRIAVYQLALSLFESGKRNEAKPLLEECCKRDDVVAQNSLLHLGIIGLEEENETAARLAFEQASNMTHDDKLREEAMYNYALCLHRTRYSPFAESVKVFERFLNEYPASEYCDNVNSYLVEVYMNTRNYDVALQSIDKIEKPSPAIYEAKQKVLYRLGVQEFINGDMNKAITNFSRSIELAKYNSTTHSDALYWRGEAYYNKEDYATAEANYKKVLSLGDNNMAKATYGLAYTYFQRGNLNSAEREFTRFIEIAGKEERELCADAYNRIADCYFYKRDYKKADELYNKASGIDGGHGDYALYRSGIAQGLRKDYTAKVATLKQLVKRFPESSYAQQGYYEMGRAYIEMEKADKAIEAFEQIEKLYPQSDIARRATAEKAMLYNNIGDYKKAIETYKQIITRYPNSEEAQIAGQDLKALYIEQGDIETFAEFASKAKGLKPVESNEIDTLSFIAAEKIYGRGATKEAKEKFESYLQKFPQGAFTLDSHYHLGVINYNMGNGTEAYTHFTHVTELADSKYSEEALAYSADICYGDEEWGKAMELYKRLMAKSSNSERVNGCKMYILRCAHNMGDNSAVISAAKEALATEQAPEERREALSYLAKAQLANNDNTAEESLKELANDTRDIYGAEGKYLLAEYIFGQKRYDDCEKEIFDYIEKSTPHSYWLARSFVLLSDLYTTQGRTMEAKQYLLSLQSNYEGEDDIESLIEERLEKLSANE